MKAAAAPPRWFQAAIGLWGGLAIVAGNMGLIASLRPPAPQALVVALTILLLAMGRFAPDLRAWLRAQDPGKLIGVHLIRFIGVVFLIDSRQGRLPFAFAVPGGIGDIAVAAVAAVLLVAPRGPRWSAAAFYWNLFGLADILFVVIEAARLSLRDPSSMQALLRMPLAVLPAFVVPVIIASHVWLLGKLRGPARGPAGVA